MEIAPATAATGGTVVLNLFRRTASSTGPDPGLTRHERRLLKRLVEGHTYGTAAQQFGISINTVAFHMREIYKNLQAHSKSEAVAAALKRRPVCAAKIPT